MSAADCRAARRKMYMRYGKANKRSVAESIAAERRKAMREAAAKGSKKK